MIESMKRVIDAWDASVLPKNHDGRLWQVLEEMRQDIAKADKQEPVAWLSIDGVGERYLCFDKPLDNEPVQPLYTHPQAREPLTQQEVVDGFCKQPHDVQFVSVFNAGVRFAEAAHGIKGEA